MKTSGPAALTQIDQADDAARSTDHATAAVKISEPASLTQLDEADDAARSTNNISVAQANSPPPQNFVVNNERVLSAGSSFLRAEDVPVTGAAVPISLSATVQTIAPPVEVDLGRPPLPASVVR